MLKQITARIILACLLGLVFLTSHAQDSEEFLGETIHINTYFHSFVGKPSWLLVIRDLDHGQNIPYVFDVKRGENAWIALTYSKNYLIIASTLQMSTYGTHQNRFKKFTIHNFCQLESQGRIIHGKSIYLTITGDLTPSADSINCRVSRYDTG